MGRITQLAVGARLRSPTMEVSRLGISGLALPSFEANLSLPAFREIVPTQTHQLLDYGYIVAPLVEEQTDPGAVT